MEILYSWTQYIIEHALSYADMHGDSSMFLNNDKEVASATSTEDTSMENVLNSIIEYDSQVILTTVFLTMTAFCKDE